MQSERTPISDAVRAEFADYFADPAHDGRFQNPWPHPPLPTLPDVVRWKVKSNALRSAGYVTTPVELPRTPLADYDTLTSADTRVFWIGHASFLIEMAGARFVIDPIFGRAGSVVKRETPPAATPEQLRERGLNAVLVTHGHHDHCDPAALRRLADADNVTFIVPKGLGAALPRECRPLIELDWWHYVDVSGTRVHLVPAQHWSRRGAFDLNRALWGGFVLEGKHRVYHSGDTGYFAGFTPIGRVFGGIDVACLPLGAYEPRWFMSAQHMAPEEALDALAALSATHFVGMHWGAYDLSDEPLVAGTQLATERARERGLGHERLHIVRPGGSLALHGAPGATTAEVLHRYAAPGA
jgi:L-ascorbate metabolism protein UlaG (beta-lactamase superfamily)